MPMTFDDDRLIQDGERMFRPKRSDESIVEYRDAFACDQDRKDPVQAHEIRTGVPWNKWTNKQFDQLTRRHPELAVSNPMVISRMLRGGL